MSKTDDRRFDELAGTARDFESLAREAIRARGSAEDRARMSEAALAVLDDTLSFVLRQMDAGDGVQARLGLHRALGTVRRAFSSSFARRLESELWPTDVPTDQT